MGRDHSCETCGRGGFNDPDGRCVCSAPTDEDVTDALRDLIACADHYRACPGVRGREDVLIAALDSARAVLDSLPTPTRERER